MLNVKVICLYMLMCIYTIHLHKHTHPDLYVCDCLLKFSGTQKFTILMKFSDIAEFQTVQFLFKVKKGNVAMNVAKVDFWNLLLDKN